MMIWMPDCSDTTELSCMVVCDDEDIGELIGDEDNDEEGDAKGREDEETDCELVAFTFA